ncbi:MAG: synthase family protein [Acidimicrobiaceae bacterium]|nr:synthase family protein [Acidimicrobiaceae bacterium]
MARALVLRHHLEDSPGLIGEALEARGFELDVAMMEGATPPPSLEGYDVMIILGSKCAVYDHEVEAAWFHRELALIGEADGRSLPILGICFGAQALCRYFGGTVSRAVDGEVGWFEIDVTPGVGLESGPWFEFHFDHCALPEGAELWATSPRAVQAFAVGHHVGVQFHPEIDDAQLKEWLAADEDDARELGLDVDALLAETARETPAARLRARSLVELFLSRLA